jgi:DNA-binding CsgD family transcriptional regulator
MGETDEFGSAETALYRAALQHPGASLAELADVLEQDVLDLDKPLRRMVEMSLLRVDDADRVSAVSPMLAEAIVLGAEDLELGVRRASVESRRNAIRRLIVDWNDTLSAAGEVTPSVQVIEDQNQMGNVLMHYADRCRDELLSVAPGRLPKTRIDSRTRIANLYSARRGIRSRLIYQHTALRDRHTRSYLTEMADNGARIRFAGSVPGRSLVIDREVALLPLPTNDANQAGLAVVHEPMSRQSDAAELDQTRGAILRLMAEGEKDEAISRRLSISVRTCRRQIADYMAQVGATSRFQAGVIAARAGHLDIGSP